MTHGSLFSGIGGFDLAAEWMGWENIFHCEYDPFCQKVLAHHFPKSKLYDNVKTFDATKYRGRIDILTGGFPCQPFSSAGLRKGTEDDRHLWPCMLRLIREIQPRYILGENVRGILNWSGGLVFDEIITDLENEGYEVSPYILPACGKNAPHRRDRVWFVAFNADRNVEGQVAEVCRGQNTQPGGVHGSISDTGSDGLCRSNQPSHGRINLGDGNALNESVALCGHRDAPDTKRIRLEHGAKAGNVQEGASASQSEGGESSESIEANGIGRDAPDTDSNGGQKDTKRNRKRQGTKKQYERLHIHGESGNAPDTHSGRLERTTKERRDCFNVEREGEFGNAPDTNEERSELRNGQREGGRSQQTQRTESFSKPGDWEEFPTFSPLCGGDDGFPKRLDGISFPKWRNESIKAFGNAIVPQVAFEIFQAIEKTDVEFRKSELHCKNKTDE